MYPLPHFVFLTLTTITMPKFNVTLNLNLHLHEYNEVAGEYYDDDEGEMKEAYDRTDAYYKKHSIEEYVKTFHTFTFAENLISDGELISADWDKEKLALHMVVETEQSKEQLLDDLRGVSLEDGEYEGYGDSGWLLFTRLPGDEVFNGGEEKGWLYADVDYRRSKIVINEVEEDEEEEEEDCDEVVIRGKTTMTLGALIEELTKLKESLGHNAPVWHTQFGALTASTSVETVAKANGGGICIR